MKTETGRAKMGGWQSRYERAGRLAADGEWGPSREVYERLAAETNDARLHALVANDLAALSAVQGNLAEALDGFQRALAHDENCALARDNFVTLQECSNEPVAARSVLGDLETPSAGDAEDSYTDAPVRVAVLSFLFNWPSTGGGIIHTVELVRFLNQSGFDVRHIYARNPGWGVGRQDAKLPYQPHVLAFHDSEWNMPTVQRRFRQAVDEFDPHCVIITDSWNSKPLLAQAVADYPYLLRMQGRECLCPLNNLRLLPKGKRCLKHQLATPEQCRACLAQHGRTSGGLHQAERALCGVETDAYQQRLRSAFHEAAAVLVIDPEAEALVGPYCREAHVVPSGFDPDRFPWPWTQEPPRLSEKLTLLMAGVVEDPIKGFHILHEACRRLWRRRQDFVLMATGQPPGEVDAFTQFVGWLSQDELPRYLRASDVVVLPAIGPEALGRTAVEAMAVVRPVVASRIGGLPHTVSDGAGLLFEPGDPDDLAEKLQLLMDDPELRETMGRLGRRRFEQHFTWPVIIERHYRPLLRRLARGQTQINATGQSSSRG